MLTVQLKNTKNLDLSKSSFIDDENDGHKLKLLLEDEKRAVRKLTLKIKKLQETLSKQRLQKGTIKRTNSEGGQSQQLLSILKFQIEKSRETEELLKVIMARIGQLTNQLSVQGLINENPQYKSQIRTTSQKQHHYHSSAANLSSTTKQESEHTSVQEAALKQLTLLQNCVRTLTENYKVIKSDNQLLLYERRQLQALEGLLRKEKESLADVEKELQAERRTRLKLKRLLEKSQCQNNILMRKIDKIGGRELDLSLKKREEWVKLSKSLTLRITDLEKEKKQMYSQCMRQKQTWNKKYGQLLKTVKSMQLTRR